MQQADTPEVKKKTLIDQTDSVLSVVRGLQALACAALNTPEIITVKILAQHQRLLVTLRGAKAANLRNR